MGVLTKALQPGRADFWPQDIRALGIGGYSDSPLFDTSLSTDKALTLPSYFGAVRVVAEDVAKLPLILYRRLSPGKERAPDHPLYPILHDSPNPEMTSFYWRETSMGHLLTWGNCYSEIVRDGRGDVTEIWPLPPDRIEVRRDDAGQKFYRLRHRSGDITDLPGRNVFHIAGIGFDGYTGFSIISLMRRAINLGLSAQQHGESFWKNNARPGGALVVPREVRMTDEAAGKLAGQFRASHEGLSNAQRISVLKDGITFQEIGIPPGDAQFIETRKFQREEIATFMRIPPHKLGDLSRATFSNIEQQSLDYIQDCLSGWLIRWEQQIGMSLIGRGDRSHFSEHLIDALLRGDSMARAQSLWIQRQAGVINADEWREIENRNPLPDGDGQVFLQPLNMTTVGAPPPGAIADQVKPQPGQPNPQPAPDQPLLTVIKAAQPPDAFSGLNGIGTPEEPKPSRVPLR